MSSLPLRNHRGDSRAERENDSRVWVAVVVTLSNQWGILRLLTQALNDVQDLGDSSVTCGSL